MSGSHLPQGRAGDAPGQRAERPAAPDPPQRPPPGRPDRDPHAGHDRDPHAGHDRDPHASHDRDPHAGHDRDIPPARRAARRGPSTRVRIRAKMSSKPALRDAFLLHEVLGPPTALRGPGPRAPGG